MVRRELKGLLDLPGPRVPLGLKVLLVLTERMVRRELKDPLDQPVPRALMEMLMAQ